MVMIDPAIIERLLAVDTSFIGMPHYSKKTKKTKKGQAKDIYWFKNILRYVPFCKDLDEMNQKAVINVYKRVDVENQQRGGNNFRANLQCLSDCLRQGVEDPGLGASTQLCGGSGRSADLATLVLTNLKANTNQITDAALNKQMGKMDLGNDDDEDNPNVDTSEAGQRKKVQAEQDGLIKMIEQKLESMDLDG